MKEYHIGVMSILGQIGGQLEQIGELTARAASVIRRGGAVWTSMNIGHLAPHEQSETRGGSPRIMNDHGDYYTVDFSKPRKGDMVFTNFCDRAVQAARDRGAYVVAVTTNYINNEFRPAGVTIPNEDNLLLRDVSSEILHSHVPYSNGLVHAPQIPELTLCPSSAIGHAALHWMLNAGLAHRLAKGHALAGATGAQYLNILMERISGIGEHEDRIRETAVSMTRRIQSGGCWHVRSLEHPGLASELDYVECGPRIVNRLGDWNLRKEENVLLINAISPAYPDEVRLAAEEQSRGALVIVIAPAAMDGMVPCTRLIDSADISFDNYSPESGGVIRIEGRSGTICPTSGIAGNVIQQMICAQWTDEMIRRGLVPSFFMGMRQQGGTQYNRKLQPLAEKQGY